MADRIEKDSLGEVRVPAQALWGAQTQRAIENFKVSGRKPHKSFILATVQIKKAAARTHAKVGWLKPAEARAIIHACDEVLAGRHLDQFVVDVFQAGAGTSHNMNVNEVLAHLANRSIKGKGKIHPNDHVNMGQSTNDVIPTAIRLSALSLLGNLIDEVEALGASMKKRAIDFKKVVKSGRTHLQDAAPITMGQEFGAYATCLMKHTKRILVASEELKTLGIGGSAVGTGLNTHRAYARLMAQFLSQQTGSKLKPQADLFEAMQCMAPFVAVSNTLRNLSLDLIRIANDFRLLASGPLTGLGELLLPSRQPGSSIMPGKVNPVMAECLNMVCFQVLGLDTTIALASQAGQLELNVMMPVIAYNLNEEITILTGGVEGFRARCVEGLKADEARCLGYADKSLSVATALNPLIGYEKASQAVKEALRTGKTIREVVLSEGWLTADEYRERVQWDRLVSPHGRPTR